MKKSQPRRVSSKTRFFTIKALAYVSGDNGYVWEVRSVQGYAAERLFPLAPDFESGVCIAYAAQSWNDGIRLVQRSYPNECDSLASSTSLTRRVSIRHCEFEMVSPPPDAALCVCVGTTY